MRGDLAGARELVGDCGLIPTVVEGVDEIELGWITRRRHVDLEPLRRLEQLEAGRARGVGTERPDGHRCDR
jgi:hypothetical protein